jgi:hypothetical protein
LKYSFCLYLEQKHPKNLLFMISETEDRDCSAKTVSAFLSECLEAGRAIALRAEKQM